MKSIVYALSTFLALSAASAAFAGERAYDGQWAVKMVTLKGKCDPSLSWDVGVAASRIANSGSFMQSSGAVDPQGHVTLLLTVGADRVSARGKLNGASGFGAWKWPTRECSGRWRAAKRA